MIRGIGILAAVAMGVAMSVTAGWGSASAFAASSASSTKVIFIGGVGSVKSSIRPCFKDFDVYSLTEGQRQVQALANKINENPNQRYLVVGHSSGAAPAENIARRVKNKKQIKLVELDGMADLKVQANLPEASCWYSTNRRMKSRNAGSMAKCTHVFHVTAPTCRTQWCLHFALVNWNVPKDLNGKTFKAHGYDDCRGNRAWSK